MEKMKHNIVMRPRLWYSARGIETMFPDRTTQDEETISTALSTVKALYSIQAFQAIASTTEPFLFMRPTNSIVVDVSDASFALRHFKTKHSQYPSDRVRERETSEDLDMSLSLAAFETRLLLINRLFELIAQYTGVAVQEIGNLGYYTYPTALLLGRKHVTISTETKQLRLSQQMTKRITRALEKFAKSNTAFATAKDIALTAYSTAKK
jgi:hypothetical protein